MLVTMKAGRLPSFSSTVLFSNDLNTDACADFIAAGIDTAVAAAPSSPLLSLCCRLADSPDSAVAPTVKVAKDAAPRASVLRAPAAHHRFCCCSCCCCCCCASWAILARDAGSFSSDPSPGAAAPSVAAAAAAGKGALVLARRKRRLSMAEHVYRCCCCCC